MFSARDIFLTYNKKYFNEDVFTFSIPILHGIGFFIIIKAMLYFNKRSIQATTGDLTLKFNFENTLY